MTIDGSKFRIKLLFLAVILWQPLQYVFEARFGDAYPLLQLPKFRGSLSDSAGDVPLEGVEIEASFADGTTSTIAPEALLSQVPSPYRQPILAHVFGLMTPEAAQGNGLWERTKILLFPGFLASRARSSRVDVDAETKLWLEKRLLALYPNRRAVKVIFVWRSDVYHTGASPITVTRRQVGVREVSLGSR